MANSRWIGSAALLSAIAATGLLSGCSGDSATPDGAKSVTAASSNAGPKTTEGSGIDLPSPDSTKSGDDPFATIKLPTPDMLKNDPGIDPSDAAHKGPWINDYKAALAQAKAEGKDILMDFTGSDWCHWCIQLNREVFSKPEFLKYAPDNFVLLELDFPQNPAGIKPETRRQNQQLAEKFGVEGYPSIVLADASGRIYAKTGYQEGGPRSYIPHLEGFRKQRIERDDAFASAEKASGIERAKLLDEGLKALSQEMVLPGHKSVVEEIIALDAQNAAGLKSSYGDMLTNVEFVARIEQISKSAKDADDALKQIDAAEADFKDYRKGAFQLQIFRLQIFGKDDRKEDFNALVSTLLKSKDLSNEDRAQVHFVRIGGLARAKKFEEANNFITEALTDLAKSPEHSANLLLFRAQLLVTLKKPAEAKAAIKQAREIAPADLKEGINRFEQQLLSDLDDEEKPDVKPESK